MDRALIRLAVEVELNKPFEMPSGVERFVTAVAASPRAKGAGIHPVIWSLARKGGNDKMRWAAFFWLNKPGKIKQHRLLLADLEEDEDTLRWADEPLPTVEIPEYTEGETTATPLKGETDEIPFS